MKIIKYIFTTKIGILFFCFICYGIFYTHYRFFKETESYVVFTQPTNSETVNAKHCSEDNFGEPESFRVERALHKLVANKGIHRKAEYTQGNACKITTVGIKRDNIISSHSKNIIKSTCGTKEAREHCVDLIEQLK